MDLYECIRSQLIRVNGILAKTGNLHLLQDQPDRRSYVSVDININDEISLLRVNQPSLAIRRSPDIRYISVPGLNAARSEVEINQFSRGGRGQSRRKYPAISQARVLICYRGLSLYRCLSSPA